MIRQLMTFTTAGLILLACSGCFNSSGAGDRDKSKPGAFDPYASPIVLKVGMGVDPNFRSESGETPTNNIWTKAIKDTFNIDIKVSWQVMTQNLDQKVNLAIATGDLPDAIVVNRSQLNQMVAADQLADLTNVYNDYASPVVKKIIESTNGISKNLVTFNGKMMAIPSVDAEDMSMMWIRKDWLDQLGMEPPQTMEDLEKVAHAFVTQDPDRNGQQDTIGIAGGPTIHDDFRSNPSAFNFNPIFSAYQAYPGFWLKGADGKLVYGSTLPETRIALSKLRELYAKGLIDKDMGLYKSDAEPVIDGKAGIFFAPFYVGYWPLPDILRSNPEANWQAYALPLDANGKFNAKIFNYSKTFLVVRKGYEHPEAAIKIQNLILRDEPKYGIDLQPLRNVLAPRDEISYSVKALKQVLAGTNKPEDFTDQFEYKLLSHDIATIRNSKLEPYGNTDIRYWNTKDKDFSRAYSLLVGGRNLLDPHVNRIASFTYRSTPSMEDTWVNLSSLEKAMFTKIIMGAAPLDTFDEFVREWKRQGGDQITADIASDSQ